VSDSSIVLAARPWGRLELTPVAEYNPLREVRFGTPFALNSELE
jgi:hypothetical protein